MNKSEPVGLIFRQMSNVMNDIGAIDKERRNTQGNGYNFRGIDDVYNALHPILAKHGVFMAPTVLNQVREERKSSSGGNLIYTLLTVKYTFYSTDGSSFETVVVGEGFDSGDKSSNKAMSGAQKYALLQVFCIPTKEEKDSEYDSPVVAHKPSQPAPKQQPIARPQETKAPVKTESKAFLITEIQLQEIAKLARGAGWKDDEIKTKLSAITKKPDSSAWTAQDHNAVLAHFAKLNAANPQLNVQ